MLLRQPDPFIMEGGWAGPVTIVIGFAAVLLIGWLLEKNHGA